MKMYRVVFGVTTFVSCGLLLLMMWLFLPPNVVSDGAVVFSIAFASGIFSIWKYSYSNRDRIEHFFDAIRK